MNPNRPIGFGGSRRALPPTPHTDVARTARTQVEPSVRPPVALTATPHRAAMPDRDLRRPRTTRKRTPSFRAWSPFALVIAIIAFVGGMAGFVVTGGQSVAWVAVMLAMPAVTFIGWIILMIGLEDCANLWRRRTVASTK